MYDTILVWLLIKIEVFETILMQMFFFFLNKF